MIKTYKFKLYRSNRNRKLHRKIVAAGLTYNHCIALHRRYYRLYGRHLDKYRLQKHLTKIKKLEKFSYLLEYGSQAVQDVTDRIESGYQKFFQKENRHPPKPKKPHRFRSYTLKQAGWKLDGENHAIIIDRQRYRYHKSREVEGRIKTVTIKRDAVGDIYVFFACEVTQNGVLARLGESIGFDFGLKEHFLVAPEADGDVDMPGFFRQNHRKLKKAQQSLSRKMEANVERYIVRGKKRIPVWKRPLKECSNIQRQMKVIARLHRKITAQREAYHWQTAQALCGRYAFISIESLNMRWMQKGHGRKVNDYGFSGFVRILRHVASRTGTTVMPVDRFFPSSQICHDCGFQNTGIRDVRIRRWDCPCCGVHHDRDRNAARNILREGLRIFAAG